MGVHDVDKYPEIKRLLGIPEDEPIFILRGQDVIAPDAIRAYARKCKLMGFVSQRFTSQVEVCADEMASWQGANRERVKTPD